VIVEPGRARVHRRRNSARFVRVRAPTYSPQTSDDVAIHEGRETEFSQLIAAWPSTDSTARSHCSPARPSPLPRTSPRSPPPCASTSHHGRCWMASWSSTTTGAVTSPHSTNASPTAPANSCQLVCGVRRPRGGWPGPAGAVLSQAPQTSAAAARRHRAAAGADARHPRPCRCAGVDASMSRRVWKGW
jgi:hypothetical protein